MFDGYSFDYSEEGLDKIYRANYAAYENVFRRCGLEYLAVEADPGAIGGSENHEFMVLTENGEDTVLRCDTCAYAANAERAEVPVNPDLSARSHWLRRSSPRPVRIPSRRSVSSCRFPQSASSRPLSAPRTANLSWRWCGEIGN